MEILATRIQRMGEISQEMLKLSAELRKLALLHEQELDALSARRGLSLLSGGADCIGIRGALKGIEHDLESRIVG